MGGDDHVARRREGARSARKAQEIEPAAAKASSANARSAPSPSAAAATKAIEIDSHAINFGPQHPAAHGVLRLILEMDGEVVERADPHIGLLHRGTEKLIEYRTYMQNVPYFDRLDYVSPMCQEQSFALAVEKLLGIEAPERAKWIRVLFAEITRVLNHLLNVTTYALDVGAITPSLWGFEEREKLMEFYDAASGARLHANYFRPGGVARDLPAGLTDRIAAWAETFPKFVDELRGAADRPTASGSSARSISASCRAEDALAWGFAGPCLRASGVPWDLRRSQPYDKYDQVEFDVPVGRNGDCYDRYLVRMEEMRREREDHQAVPGEDAAGAGEGAGPQVQPAAARRDEALDGSADPSLQAVHRGLSRAARCHLHRHRDPKGEFGVYLVADGSNRPYRCKIRPTGFAFLQAIEVMARRHMLADTVAIIGSLDLVFGEVDR